MWWHTHTFPMSFLWVILSDNGGSWWKMRKMKLLGRAKATLPAPWGLSLHFRRKQNTSRHRQMYKRAGQTPLWLTISIGTTPGATSTPGVSHPRGLLHTVWRCYQACLSSIYHCHQMGKLLTQEAEFQGSGSFTDPGPIPRVFKRSLWKCMMACAGHTWGRWGLEVGTTGEEWAHPWDLGKVMSLGNACPHLHNGLLHRQKDANEQELIAWNLKER